MLICMAGTQLAIRFTQRQIETLDALAVAAHSSRSAIVKLLVDEAERARVDALYAAAYPKERGDIDGFGDLAAFHDAAEQERVDSRDAATSR